MPRFAARARIIWQNEDLKERQSPAMKNFKNRYCLSEGRSRITGGKACPSSRIREVWNEKEGLLQRRAENVGDAVVTCLGSELL